MKKLASGAATVAAIAVFATIYATVWPPWNWDVAKASLIGQLISWALN